MTKDIKKLANSIPFKAFDIYLPGRHISVINSNTIAISPKGDKLIVFTQDGNFHIINVKQITEIEIGNT